MPWLCSLAYVQVSSHTAIAQGHGGRAGLDLIVAGIHGGTLFRDLRHVLPPACHFRLFDAKDEQGKRVEAALRRVIHQPDADWQWRADEECAGLRLLSVLAHEAMLRGYWEL